MKTLALNAPSEAPQKRLLPLPELLLRLLLSVGFGTLVAVFLWLRGTPFLQAFIGCNIVGLAIFFCITLGFALFGFEKYAVRNPLIYVIGTLAGVCGGVFLQVLMAPENVMTRMLADPNAMARHLISALMLAPIGVGFFYMREKEQVTRIEFETNRRMAAERERQLVQAQLRMLQAQIEPHFLFNTLGNVRSLIEISPEAAGEMLDHVNDYFRASLTRARRDTGTIADELELLQPYLAIMQVRMGKRLRYRIVCSPELTNHPLPVMLVQPLVENAIKHGLEPRIEGGNLEIAARVLDGQLHITVTDNGMGLGLATRPSKRSSGVGLSNIRERLLALFAEKASLSLQNNPLGGVTATLMLPLQKVMV